MVVSYYCRLRFATNFLPLLSSAATTPSSSARVISVLGTGREGNLILDDLSLSKPANFSILNVEAHTVTMTSLAFEELSIRHPEIGWVHAFPGLVMTGLFRGLPTPLRAVATVATPVLKCMAVPLADSGQGFTWLGTSEGFRKGLRLVDWKGESLDARNGGGSWWSGKVEWWGVEKRRAVWEHLESVFSGVKAPGV